MRLLFCIYLIFGLFNFSAGQIISYVPAGASADEEITITYNAALGGGELADADKIYIHSGIIVAGPRSEAWTNVVGNWGEDDGIGEMTKVDGSENIWEITLSPSIRDYYSMSSDQVGYRIGFVFRNADGSVKASAQPDNYEWGEVASNGDFYINLSVDNSVVITSPLSSEIILQEGENVTVSAEASSEVTSMELFTIIDGQSTSIASVSSGTTISASYSPPVSQEVEFEVVAELNETTAQDSIISNIAILQTVVEEPLPDGLLKGINYDQADPTKVTLVLEAPQKDFVYVVGDFNDWKFDNNYFMKKDGDLFWLEINQLTPGQEYIFQYWVSDGLDEVVKVGDPYAEKVVDPWNDEFIEESVYPDLIQYNRDQNGIATVLQTDQEPYIWADSEASWQRPAEQDLMVYELLIRDFVGTHRYQEVLDSLDYLKRLGVNAIELMPIMEFEGNSSWGYNPSYFFAPDKYYGTKNDLKKFIEVCHQNGFAVILDMVLNHAFGQNAMVRMYWDDANNRPAADNPWFNQEPRHPFNVGFDFNHSSDYTKNFVDSVNQYWIQEYHFDGYRFDLSKGFTQNFTTDVGVWSSYDVGRVATLKRMYDQIRAYDETAYVILEHFGDTQEENELGAYGMLMWRNSHFDFVPALIGDGGNLQSANSTYHVSYMESHDEQRVMYEMQNFGQSEGNYDIANTAAALERAKMATAFLFLQPGPKMLWQFGELGYDLNINFNGRTGEKPLPWGASGLGYYEDELRQYVYDAYDAVLELRNSYPQAIKQEFFTGDLSSTVKTITIDHSDIDIVAIGNFGTAFEDAAFQFTKTGDWYDYFSGETVSVSSVSATQTLQAGEFKIFTDIKVSDGFRNVVVPYQNPISVNPESFGLDTEITLTLDASQTLNQSEESLAGSDEIYMVAGLVTTNEDEKSFDITKGDLSDNSIGALTNVEGDTWEITLTPREYFDVAEGTEVFRMGVFFRNADASSLGYGYRTDTIYLDVNPDGNIVKVDPARFFSDQEVTLTFDASFGDQALIDENKVYFHSGVVLSDLEEPTGSDWSNVIGNFGEDDGVGQMTPVEGTDKWEFTFTPGEYYQLADTDSIYWLSMVFRSADGNTKAGLASGTYDNVYVASNGDIFYRVLPPEEPLSVSEDIELLVYPNPASDWLRVRGIGSGLGIITIYDIRGNEIKSKGIREGDRVSIEDLLEGLYFVRIEAKKRSGTFRLLVK